MLKISKLADYATVLMSFLAEAPGQCYSAASLSEQTEISRPTVGKLLKILQQARLVKSTQGAQGGYELGTSADKITVADIIAAVDGDLALTECGQTDNDCVRKGCCSLKGNWQFINKRVYGVLRNISLANMLDELHTKPVIFMMN